MAHIKNPVRYQRRRPAARCPGGAGPGAHAAPNSSQGFFSLTASIALCAVLNTGVPNPRGVTWKLWGDLCVCLHVCVYVCVWSSCLTHTTYLTCPPPTIPHRHREQVSISHPHPLYTHRHTHTHTHTDTHTLYHHTCLFT